MTSKPHHDGDGPVELHVPWTTIIKLLVAILLVFIAIRLFPFALILLLSVLMAVSLFPVVRMMRDRGVSHGIAVSIIGVALCAMIVALLWLIIPPMVTEGTALVKSMPEIRERLRASMPQEGLLRLITDQSESSLVPDTSAMVKQTVSIGRTALGGVVEVGLILAISVYLLLDGERTYAWLLPYLPRKHRGKMHETANEISGVIFAYMSGQFITSALCTVYTAVLLTILDVPAAFILAVLAGLLDVLPVLGFFISIIPAILLALTVSPSTALMVAAFYVFYNLIENYLIVPKVYGNRLRMSTLTVLLAVLVGGLLAGIPGAIAVLPVVASYPIVERIWLKEFLGREVVAEHAKDPEPPQSTPPGAVEPSLPG
ncbi:MAG: AI-2E family transporter [Planctomycetes bacterium]|nr:AI-2E family transporter [Planctomycetota bacterium]